ncbi:hypothetical protein RND71_030821 [Anisodus tanguticus]|uniref:Uncharacterized protein n=1 Tax=Anisodus tanguticus TaxID=243964 RepID=A0AAE1RH46_9SOLA|nr:hypothetical protein RND71_030821 [Anisodus tanguticus]
MPDLLSNSSSLSNNMLKSLFSSLDVAAKTISESYLMLLLEDDEFDNKFGSNDNQQGTSDGNDNQLQGKSDDKQRKEHNSKLRIEPLQDKIWFQIKRTQMKMGKPDMSISKVDKESTSIVKVDAEPILGFQSQHLANLRLTLLNDIALKVKGDVQTRKGLWWIPRHPETRNGLVIGEMLRGVENKHRFGDSRIGQPFELLLNPWAGKIQHGELKHLSSQRNRLVTRLRIP